jgi:hypothetical protein
MKKITNTIKHLSLILGILLALSYSNTLSAQTEEDYYEVEEEEEVSFFGDGLNGSRFESNLDNDYQTARPNYQYNNNRSSSNTNAFGNESQQPIKELDIETHRNYSSEGVVVIGGGGGGSNNAPSNYVPGVGSTITPGTITPPLKGGGNGNSVPDNGGDPDVPIDGGIGFLIAAGIGYGIKKTYSKPQKK